MTFTLTQVARTCIFAARQARTRADLTAWVQDNRKTVKSVLPAALAGDVIEQARQHWRGLER